MNLDAIDATIESIYDAALDPARWPEALSRTADACHGVGALIANDDFVRPERAFIWLGRLAPELYADYVETYMPINPWAIGAALIKPGTAVAFDSLVSARNLKRSAFYTDILKPQGILHCMGETGLRTESGTLAAAVVRSPQAGPATDDDLALFAQFSPHLSRAARLSIRIGESLARAHSLERGFDALAHGVILLDSAARLVWANRAADRILTANDGLTLAQSMLRGPSPEQSRALAALLADVIARRGGTSALRIERPSLQEPYIVFAAPLAPARLWSGASDAAAIVIISTAEVRGRDTEPLLAAIYGLTPTEARVALLVASGRTLAEAAQSLAVSANTVHTHLQRIFRKLGIRRQAELAAIVSGLPALSNVDL